MNCSKLSLYFHGYRSIQKERGFYYGISRQKHGPYDPNYCAPDYEPVQMTSEHNLVIMKIFASMKVILFYQRMYSTRAIIILFWLITIHTLHRGAFCQSPFRWIYYCHSSKLTGKENSNYFSTQNNFYIRAGLLGSMNCASQTLSPL